ncbi:MAG: chromate resistance protein ChrB domain-containing protein [Thermodesulfovibrionales bacterium]
MKSTIKRNFNGGQNWLLFFYSVPSKPVSNRMKIWRKLSKTGTMQLKGAVYILPMNEEHYEFFQWLVSEVSSMGGEAAFTRVEAIDSIKDEEIKALFNERQEGGYQAIGKSLDDLETRVNSIQKGSKTQGGQALSEQLDKVRKNYEEALKTDFFLSKSGAALRSRIDALNAVIKGLTGSVVKSKPAVVSSRKIEDYQGSVWVSRKRPFVDRMASAWLIKRFIDKNGTFKLVDEKDLAAAGQNHVTFDVSDGVFTHLGDLCTFEVLVKSFGLKDKAVRKIAEIVHDLDMKDDKYKSAEAKGLEDILTGIRMTAKDDTEALEKGMAVFEMLYASKG